MRVKNKIIAIDFDGTLTRNGGYPRIPEPAIIHKIIGWWIYWQQKQGAFIILNTCREGAALSAAINWIGYHYGWFPDLCNANHPDLIRRYGDCRKISCDLNIDDKNIGIIGFILRKTN